MHYKMGDKEDYLGSNKDSRVIHEQIIFMSPWLPKYMSPTYLVMR